MSFEAEFCEAIPLPSGDTRMLVVSAVGDGHADRRSEAGAIGNRSVGAPLAGIAHPSRRVLTTNATIAS